MIMDLILLLSLVMCAREGSVEGRWLTIGFMEVLGVGGAHDHTSCVVVSVEEKFDGRNNTQRKGCSGYSRPPPPAPAPFRWHQHLRVCVGTYETKGPRGHVLR